jgi:hypothetical protein
MQCGQGIQLLNVKESKLQELVVSAGIHTHTSPLLIIQTNYGIHPTSYSTHTAVLSRGYSGRGVKLTYRLQLALRLWLKDSTKGQTHDATSLKTARRIVMVKLSLFTPRKHAEGTKAQLHSFLSSELDEGEWSTSRPGHFSGWK